MNKIGTLLASTMLAVGFSATAMAADINLTISSWLPPSHPINTEMLEGLVDMMEEAISRAALSAQN